MNLRFLFKIRYFSLQMFMFFSLSSPAQPAVIPADVYRWDAAPVSENATSQQRIFLEGSTPAFSHLKVHATTASAPLSLTEVELHPGHAHADEELIIVKSGELTVTISGKTEILEAGSIALISPNDEHSFANQGDRPVAYYVMRYQASRPSATRSAEAKQSFIKHWDGLAFKPNDKGGRRNVFDTATAQSERFEMHVTTLNEGLMSHPPHTHKAAEILLLIEGQAEESINGKWLPAGVGDIIFLQSEVPHAIRNTGKGACTYFAFQFE